MRLATQPHGTEYSTPLYLELLAKEDNVIVLIGYCCKCGVKKFVGIRGLGFAIGIGQVGLGE